jgi:hypothetical protein
VNVRELIEILKDYPPDTEIEMGIIAPVTDEDQIAVDRYPIEGVLPWEDDHDDGDGDGEAVLWLIGGEEDDVEAFLDAIDDDEIEPTEDEADEAEAAAEAETEAAEAETDE